MRIKEIQNLIKFVAKSGVSEVKLEMEKLKLTIKTGSSATQSVVQQAAPVVQTPVIAELHNKGANYWNILQKTLPRQTCFCRNWRFYF
jgi:hypothetical protein